MKWLIWIFFTFPLFAADICDPDPAPRISKYNDPQITQAKEITLRIKKTSQLSFKDYSEDTKYGSYLSFDLPFESYKNVYEQLKSDYPNLKTRNEAHITLLTPVEFYCQFKPAGTTIAMLVKKIEEFLVANNYRFDFDATSLGSHQVGNDETFFVIVTGADLFTLREKWAELPNVGFRPRNFYPHITLGFTNKDLHSSQGVLKDEKHSLDRRYKLKIHLD